MAITVYKPVHVMTKNSRIYDKVNATIKASYLLHADADEHTVVFINKIEQLSLYIEYLKKLSKINCNCQSIIIYCW